MTNYNTAGCTLHCKKAARNSDVDNGGANQTTWGSYSKIPIPSSLGSAPPLSTSEFGAFRHGFFYSVGYSDFLC
jgi:hypothetical protein